MISLICGDALNIPLASGTVQTCVTSPPYYGLRDYGIAGQMGLESTPEEYVTKMVAVFREVWRVLRDDGTLWLNLGDSYAGSGGVGNQRDDANKGNMAHFKNPNSYTITKSKRIERGSGRWGGGNLPATNGLKPKDLIGIPWRVAFALQADGWYLRSDIIWHKPNPMPESVRDRPTKAHEFLFLLSKSQRYFYDADAIREPGTGTEYDLSQRESGRMEGRPSMEARGYKSQGESFGKGSQWRNRRTVWTIATSPYTGAHFATFPPALVEPCILAGSKDGDLILDPFAGTFTVGMVAAKHRRNTVGVELNPKYIELAKKRCADLQVVMPLSG